MKVEVVLTADPETVRTVEGVSSVHVKDGVFHVICEGLGILHYPVCNVAILCTIHREENS